MNRFPHTLSHKLDSSYECAMITADLYLLLNDPDYVASTGVAPSWVYLKRLSTSLPSRREAHLPRLVLLQHVQPYPSSLFATLKLRFTTITTRYNSLSTHTLLLLPPLLPTTHL